MYAKLRNLPAALTHRWNFMLDAFMRALTDAGHPFFHLTDASAAVPYRQLLCNECYAKCHVAFTIHPNDLPALHWFWRGIAGLQYLADPRTHPCLHAQVALRDQEKLYALYELLLLTT